MNNGGVEAPAHHGELKARLIRQLASRCSPYSNLGGGCPENQRPYAMVCSAKGAGIGPELNPAYQGLMMPWQPAWRCARPTGVSNMKKALLAAAMSILTVSAISTGSALAANVPCEDMLSQVREAKSSTNLNATDEKKLAELEAKGVERCNADDDKRADEFFGQALKLLGR